jgi:hypothetical protein
LKGEQPTAGVTGKRGDLAAKKLSDAESAIGAAILKVRAKAPHLSGARGVRRDFMAEQWGECSKAKLVLGAR